MAKRTGRDFSVPYPERNKVGRERRAVRKEAQDVTSGKKRGKADNHP